MPAILTESPQEAAWWVRAGYLVVFPTETVFGLGADARSDEAVAKIFAAKSRPKDNPLIVHVGFKEQIPQVARAIPESASRLIDTFFPGPLTVILPKGPDIPSIVTAGLDTVAVRMPSLSVAKQFLKAADCPVAAPSANISGRPSATSWQAAYEDLQSHVDCVLCHDPAETGLESTVVDCIGDPPRLLRPGAVSLESLLTVVPDISTAAGHTERSPGMRHRHYAPAAKVIIVSHPKHCKAAPETAYIGLTLPEVDQSMFGALQVCSGVEEYAQRLFAFFRLCEKRGLAHIYCQQVAPVGLGRALMDRISRAATT